MGGEISREGDRKKNRIRKREREKGVTWVDKKKTGASRKQGKGREKKQTDWLAAWIKSSPFFPTDKRIQMPGKTSLCYVKHAVSLEMSWPALFILTLSSQIMAQIDTESCFGLIPVHFKEFLSSFFVCASARVCVFQRTRWCSSPWAAEYWVRALPGIHLLYQCKLLSCLSDGSGCTDMFIVCSPCNRLPNPSGRMCAAED